MSAFESFPFFFLSTLPFFLLGGPLMFWEGEGLLAISFTFSKKEYDKEDTLNIASLIVPHKLGFLDRNSYVLDIGA